MSASISCYSKITVKRKVKLHTTNDTKMLLNWLNIPMNWKCKRCQASSNLWKTCHFTRLAFPMRSKRSRRRLPWICGQDRQLTTMSRAVMSRRSQLSRLFTRWNMLVARQICLALASLWVSPSLSCSWYSIFAFSSILLSQNQKISTKNLCWDSTLELLCVVCTILH